MGFTSLHVGRFLFAETGIDGSGVFMERSIECSIKSSSNVRWNVVCRFPFADVARWLEALMDVWIMSGENSETSALSAYPTLATHPFPRTQARMHACTHARIRALVSALIQIWHTCTNACLHTHMLERMQPMHAHVCVSVCEAGI